MSTQPSAGRFNAYDRPHEDLRTFVRRVDEAGELLRVDGADWNLEVGAIADLVDHARPEPTDPFDVMWAICTRCDPANDIEILRRTWSGPLDPMLDGTSSTNSRALIDACRPFEHLQDFPLVARASPALRARVFGKFADILKTIGA